MSNESPLANPPAQPDTSNMFAVGVTGVSMSKVIINLPVPRPLTREQALNLAAWLIVLADPEGKDFARLVEAIKKK